MDYLAKNIKSYEKLLSIRYKMIIDRKRKDKREINLVFNVAEFPHLLGLQNLSKHLPKLKKSGDKIWFDIKQGNITYKELTSYKNYAKIKDKIEYLHMLEQLIDVNELIFYYNNDRNKYSKFDSEFVLKSVSKCGKVIFLGLDKNKHGEYYVRSFAPQIGKNDLTLGQMQYVLLYKEKVNLDTKTTEVLYDRIK